ncbi:hypothetical protein MKW98_031038 [Papaver atlanticum]|uniref:Uncharacterized protein n=1 Tax=Papaver atlanticum TaxID=357466 RepID=A0AAD4XJR6_9MAGN|nr:hypothetical protein MKW98_031038 [Papaver atlanticum]
MASIHDTPFYDMPGIHRIRELSPEEEEMQIRRNLKVRDMLIRKKLDILERVAKAAGRPFKRYANKIKGYDWLIDSPREMIQCVFMIPGERSHCTTSGGMLVVLQLCLSLGPGVFLHLRFPH